MLTSEIYYSKEFKGLLSECVLFRIKYPRGGQYNDGHELLGKLVFESGKALLSGLNALGVEYFLHKEKPDFWCPPPLNVEGTLYWIEYKTHCECFGYRMHICIGTGTNDFSIEFNFNSESFYDVSMDDVKRAISFEKVLISHGLLRLASQNVEE